MKKILMLALVLNAMSAMANVAVELEGNNYNCEKKSTDIFHCESEGKKILITKNAYGYTAYEKSSQEVPVIKWVSKVTDDDKVLYEIPKISIPGGMTLNSGGFNLSDTKSSRLSNANSIMIFLKDVKDDLAIDFVNDAKKYIDGQNEKNAKAKIVSGGKEYSCTRGEDQLNARAEVNVGGMLGGFGVVNSQCSYYACTNSNGEKILGFIPKPGTFQNPYFLNIKGEETELRFDDMKIFDNEKGEGIPSYDLPKFNGYGANVVNSEINENLFIPSKFEKNKSTFSFLTNPFTAPMLEETAKLCGGSNDVKKLLDEERSIAEQFKNDLATTELSHYLTMTNGQMLSVLVDAAKGRDLGCRYDDMILSPSAQAHLEYLQKAKPKPVEKYLSESEVQDLFKKAKSMEDIPFAYKYDGCYARAHVMARRFEAMGIPTEKVWIKGSLYVPNTDIQWNYHVAPVINVKTASGEIKKYVIDPSLNDKAVTVDEWVATMGKSVKGGVIKTAYPFPVNVANFQRTAVAISSSDIYVPDNDEVRSEADNMNMAVQTMKEYSQVLKENQKTKQKGTTNEKNNTTLDVI